MASVASQLIEEVTAHTQSDSLEDAREICADGTYFPNDLRRTKTLDTLFDVLHEVRFIFAGEKNALYNILMPLLILYITCSDMYINIHTKGIVTFSLLQCLLKCA